MIAFGVGIALRQKNCQRTITDMNIPVYINNTRVGSTDKCENITQVVFNEYSRLIPSDHRIQKIFVVGSPDSPQNVVIVTVPKENV